MFGLVMLGFVIFGLVMFGFVTSAFVMLGFVIFGFVMSGLRTAVDESPLLTMEPPMAVICATFTVMVAAAFVEVAKTLRETEEYGGIVTSSVINFENCKKDAVPPVGWLAIVKRTFSGCPVEFCASTGNAR